LSEPIKGVFTISGDTSKELTEKNLLFKFDASSLMCSPELLKIISEIFNDQVNGLKQWFYLLKYLKRPPLTLQKNFESIEDSLINSLRSISRAQYNYVSLTRIYDEIHKDLQEKENIIQDSINDKIDLTTRLADLQMKYMEIKSSQFQVNNQKMNQTNNQTNPQLVNNQSINNQINKNIVKKEEVIMIQGMIKILTNVDQDWVDSTAILFETNIIFFKEKNIKYVKNNL
jgi:hypothetical protein